MSLWFSQSGRRECESGKFRSRAPLGTVRTTGEEYRDWSFDFVSHTSGASIQRTTYSVSISDPKRHRVAYLRDFPNLKQAAVAARRWIDTRLTRNWPTMPVDLGTIPALPTAEPFAYKNL